jgi:hypothetical protein
LDKAEADISLIRNELNSLQDASDQNNDQKQPNNAANRSTNSTEANASKLTISGEAITQITDKETAQHPNGLTNNGKPFTRVQ